MSRKRDSDYIVAQTIAKLLDKLEPIVGFDRGAYLIAREALSQLAGNQGIETAAIVAHEIAASLDRGADR